MDKAARVHNALIDLGVEISADRSYDHATAVLACVAIDRFLNTASDESKARLYDIITEA